MQVLGVILAAGKGSRFKSEKPKVIHTLLGKPMVYFPYEALISLDPIKVAFIVGHKKEEVISTVKSFPQADQKVVFFEQANPKGGTGDAVKQALPLLKEHPDKVVIILNGDSPLIKGETLKEGLKKLIEHSLDGVIFTTILEDPTGYGRIVRDEKDHVVEIVEEKDASEAQRKIKEVNGGFYIFRVQPLLEALKELKPSPVSGEVYLTDVVKILHSKGYKVDTYQTPYWELLGVNNRRQLAEAEKLLLERKIENLQREGVTVRLPETVYIEWDVQVGKDTEIEPHAVLKGNTKVGENCLIGVGSILENTTVENNVEILPYSYISDSQIEEGCVIGPFARIRNQSHLKEKCEIGNFVEVKKSTIGRKTKAKHLSYIGDAQIGDNTNIGAGTVFANYDGVNKYQTSVGNNVFIGSNSLIIAPRQLGDWSFIAGGSVVNKDVPPKALAVSRAPLRILEGKNPLLRKDKNS